jgi:WD40 repeat protein/serine/threonine protein kinase
MKPDQERRLEELFDAACALSPVARAAFLDRACAGNAALRQEVESLLAAHEQAGDYLLRPAAVGARAAQKTVSLPPISEPAGRRIGRYKLLEQIGEGGFGVVWMAEQEEPVRRRVALKIIKLGMDTKEVVARFEAERQALAMMDHPNIASVFDGGATDTGRPYFVMELVKGVPITSYCDANQLSTRERLELFMQVCRAVQHAHQKGVIHRDLKPSNILVTEQDGAPQPKVIDFGVAKATQARLTERTLFTGLHQMIGTPAYMSPEQAGLGALDIDTRSDIYALGALLYELLTGRTPFTREEFEKAGLDEIFRLIREQDPPKPSTRLSRLTHEELTTISTRRQSEPAKLNRLVQGDLDWIVMKCLEKNPRRRYETPDGLAQDVARYLKTEPVLARPLNLRYTLAKFVRRHRFGVGFGTALAVAILAGSGFSLWQAIRASHQAQLAEARRHDADTQRQAATQAQSRAQQSALEVSHLLARRYVDEGTQLMDEGNYLGALLWFAEALRRDSTEPASEALHRVRIGAVLRACPSLLQVFVHQSDVNSVNFSADARWLVSASSDGTARVWDAHTGTALSPPLVHTGAVACASFSPDGGRVVSASLDHTARVWDARTGKPITAPLAHAREVLHAEFSPDGRRVITASMDKTAQVWDATTGQPVTPPLVHEDAVFPAAFSPDGRFVVTASQDKTALVWDAETGRPVTPPLQHSGKVWWATFSPDGKQVATASEDQTARLWDARTGAPVAQPLPHTQRVIYVAFSPDSRRIVTATGESILTGFLEFKDAPGEARVWDVATGKALGLPMPHKLGLWFASFSPDGRWVVTGSRDKTARVWDAATGQPVTPSLLHGEDVFRAVFSPDGRRLATASFEGIARIWGLEMDQRTPLELQESSGAGAFSFSSDGQRLAGSYFDGDGRIWDAVTGAPLTSHLHARTTVRQICFSKDSRFVATASADHTARIWDVQTGAAITPPLRHNAEVVCVAFSPDGQGLATASTDQTARLWSIPTGVPLTPPLRHASNLLCVAFSPNGRLLVTTSEDKTARLWDAATGASIVPPLAHQEGVALAAFSPDSRRLATASSDGVVQLWDANTGRPSAPPIKMAGRFIMLHGVESIVFSPDSRRIVVADSDKTARIWDVESGAPVAPPLRHNGAVLYAAFSHHGSYVVTVSEDMTARVWDAATGQPITPPLAHDGKVMYALFTADDDAVRTISDDSASHGIRVWRWDLTPDRRPAEELQALSELLSMHRLDASGTPVPLPSAAVSNAWQILHPQ